MQKQFFVRLLITTALAFNLSLAFAAEGFGVLQKLDPAGKKVKMAHEPIPEIKWPAMTMDIPVADAKLLAGLQPGQKVSFTLSKQGDAGYVITRIAAAQ